MTREEWNKTDGIQAHHVIQSFNPEDNITAREANELGRKLAEEIAPGHEAAVYTHTDRDHVHNHIVINSVSFEDGKKYHSDREQLYNIREASDRLCREHGLSVVQEHTQPERLTMAERQIRQRGESPWKDELRNAIDKAKEHSKSLDDMKDYLQKNFGIEMKIQNKNVSFLHPEKEKFCRGKTLGEAYTKDTLTKELGKERGRESKQKIFDRPIQQKPLPKTYDLQQPQHKQPDNSNQKYQKGLDALRGLTQTKTGQQPVKSPQQQKTQGQQKHRNKRAKSRVEQQRQGPSLDR